MKPASWTQLAALCKRYIHLHAFYFPDIPLHHLNRFQSSVSRFLGYLVEQPDGKRFIQQLKLPRETCNQLEQLVPMVFFEEVDRLFEVDTPHHTLRFLIDESMLPNQVKQRLNQRLPEGLVGLGAEIKRMCAEGQEDSVFLQCMWEHLEYQSRYSLPKHAKVIHDFVLEQLHNGGVQVIPTSTFPTNTPLVEHLEFQVESLTQQLQPLLKHSLQGRAGDNNPPGYHLTPHAARLFLHSHTLHGRTSQLGGRAQDIFISVELTRYGGQEVKQPATTARTRRG